MMKKKSILGGLPLFLLALQGHSDNYNLQISAFNYTNQELRISANAFQNSGNTKGNSANIGSVVAPRGVAQNVINNGDFYSLGTSSGSQQDYESVIVGVGNDANNGNPSQVFGYQFWSIGGYNGNGSWMALAAIGPANSSLKNRCSYANQGCGQFLTEFPGQGFLNDLGASPIFSTDLTDPQPPSVSSFPVSSRILKNLWDTQQFPLLIPGGGTSGNTQVDAQGNIYGAWYLNYVMVPGFPNDELMSYYNINNTQTYGPLSTPMFVNDNSVNVFNNGQPITNSTGQYLDLNMYVTCQNVTGLEQGTCPWIGSMANTIKNLDPIIPLGPCSSVIGSQICVLPKI